MRQPESASALDHDLVTASIRLAVCLTVLGVLLVIAGLAMGLSGDGGQGPGGCANQAGQPGAAGPAHDPCDRGGTGWNQAGYALIAPGVLGLIGAATLRITARR